MSHDEAGDDRRPARISRRGQTTARSDARKPSPSPAKAPARPSASKAMRAAMTQLEELLGKVPESVSAIKRTDDGWQADVEVMEVERVPDTTSVMASYRVALDHEGELVSYERVRRYTRAEIDRDRRS